MVWNQFLFNEIIRLLKEKLKKKKLTPIKIKPGTLSAVAGRFDRFAIAAYTVVYCAYRVSFVERAASIFKIQYAENEGPIR